MAFVSAIETVGDVSGITKGGAGREATDKEITGATYADGIRFGRRGPVSAPCRTRHSARMSGWLP